MLTLLKTLFTPTRRAPDPADPLAHPAIRAMSLRELADLPLPRPCR
ncbi:MAG: hypothetical protein JXQ91_11250 [Vannielia sp.]|nr:hypothetical protein [Oceanicola sp. 502str15]